MEPDTGNVLLSAAAPPLNGTVAMVVVPFRNVTVPVGVPSNCGVTVAVRVTACPALDGFKDEAKVVVVLLIFTFWFRTGDVLPPMPPCGPLAAGCPK